MASLPQRLLGPARPVPPAGATDGVPPRLAGGVEVRTTRRGDGDLALGADGADARLRAAVGLPWASLRQVHGRGVVEAEAPDSDPSSPREGDALVSSCRGLALVVRTADCAPIALCSPEGAFAVVHAGWRGLAGGVIEAAVGALRAMGASEVDAMLGACIRPCCYVFSAEELDEVAAAVGPEVRGRTATGQPALDLPAGVRTVLARAGVRLVGEDGACTACSGEHFSWRGRRDGGRQALVAWRP